MWQKKDTSSNKKMIFLLELVSLRGENVFKLTSPEKNIIPQPFQGSFKISDEQPRHFIYASVHQFPRVSPSSHAAGRGWNYESNKAFY